MRRMIFIAVLSFFLVQCATVTRGPMQRVRVGSDPAGGAVKLRDCGAGSTDSAKTPATDDQISNTIGALGVVGLVVGGAIWSISRGFDGIMGANYQQNRSTVVIDFNKPVPNVAGQTAVYTIRREQ